ncbi:MAG: hypothetical protein GY854_20135 [Deltaproteobacteria bacterium]|nr:hypothetical protein [Deltaproteobacteria bacterium]
MSRRKNVLRRGFTVGFLAVISLYFFAGCGASLPANAPRYSPTKVPTDGKGLLYIYRIKAYPLARKPRLIIDGKLVTEPIEKSYTWLYLPPGIHNVKLEWAWDTGAPNLDFNIEIAAQESNFLKISGSFSGGYSYFQFGSQAAMMKPEYAERELEKNCRYMAPYIQTIGN